MKLDRKVIAAFAAALVLGAGTAGAQDMKFWRIGTGSAGAVPAGGGVARRA